MICDVMSESSQSMEYNKDTILQSKIAFSTGSVFFSIKIPSFPLRLKR